MYSIKVRKYMTKADVPFNKDKNKGKPMPLIEMTGNVIEETKGMYKMELHGEGKVTSTCMKCGRPLTNDISIYYGMGPECGKHFYFVEDESDIEEIKRKIQEIKWAGWIPKSAITQILDENGNIVDSMNCDKKQYSDIIIKTGRSKNIDCINSIFIFSEYIPKLIAYIKTLPKRYYDNGSKVWEIPYECRDDFKIFLLSNDLKFQVITSTRTV